MAVHNLESLTKDQDFKVIQKLIKRAPGCCLSAVFYHRHSNNSFGTSFYVLSNMTISKKRHITLDSTQFTHTIQPTVEIVASALSCTTPVIQSRCWEIHLGVVNRFISLLLRHTQTDDKLSRIADSFPYSNKILPAQSP